VKEQMLQHQLNDRVRENESQIAAKFEKKHEKLMGIILKQQ
jgi:ribose 1,5-bisphosphokinase PhnN